MSEPHPPTAMVFFRRACGYHLQQSRWGVKRARHWFSVYKCPVCGRTADHKSRPIICRGAES